MQTQPTPKALKRLLLIVLSGLIILGVVATRATADNDIHNFLGEGIFSFRNAGQEEYTRLPFDKVVLFTGDAETLSLVVAPKYGRDKLDRTVVWFTGTVSASISGSFSLKVRQMVLDMQTYYSQLGEFRTVNGAATLPSQGECTFLNSPGTAVKIKCSAITSEGGGYIFVFTSPR